MHLDKLNDISPSPTGANMNQQPIVLQQMSSPVQVIFRMLDRIILQLVQIWVNILHYTIFSLG